MDTQEAMDAEEVETEPTGWSSKYKAVFIIIALLILVAITAKMASGNHVSSHRENLTLVSLDPPPPPPPPPQSTPPPPQEEQRMEQPMIKEAEAKSEPPKDEPPLGTGIKGGGTDNYGLSDKAGNGRIGGTSGNGSRWGWYSSQIAARIQAAMQRNRKTRSANLSVDVRVWPDSSARIARAQLTRSTGDPNLDNALRDEVLTGLQLQEPPPAGMPVPIVLHLTARQPH
jgi:outer membrane biosynthesis protein TonB